MAELLLLGTGSAVNDGSRAPTMLALRGSNSTVLIDCGDNPVRQLQRLAVPLDSVERVILTHSHPDHTSGFALLVEMLWLAGRRQPLPVHGLADTLDVVRRVFSQWDLSDWAGLFALEWNVIEPEIGAAITHGADFELTAAPGRHSVPVIGIRARDIATDSLLAFSADGEPSEGIRFLARGVDLLVHEATGPFPAHSPAQAAATLALEAGAKRLVLVHLSPQRPEFKVEHREAEEIFGGQITVGQDLDRIHF
jgi:ribonuclease Z